jgi:hypothetical protein
MAYYRAIRDQRLSSSQEYLASVRPLAEFGRALAPGELCGMNDKLVVSQV